MFASGAGAASRQSIGTTVFGGMLAATILTLLFVPVFYAVIERLRERRGQRRGRDIIRRPQRPTTARPSGIIRRHIAMRRWKVLLGGRGRSSLASVGDHVVVSQSLGPARGRGAAAAPADERCRCR